MDTRIAIKELRMLIKDLAGKQRPLKRARKTSLPSAERYALLIQATVQDNWLDVEKENALIAQCHVRLRKARITAALNLLHELRGFKHRHGHGDEYLYQRADKELRSELLVLK